LIIPGPKVGDLHPTDEDPSVGTPAWSTRTNWLDEKQKLVLRLRLPTNALRSRAP